MRRGAGTHENALDIRLSDALILAAFVLALGIVGGIVWAALSPIWAIFAIIAIHMTTLWFI